MTTPCCTARCSVSTRAYHRWAPTVPSCSSARLVMSLVLLIREALVLNTLEWEWFNGHNVPQKHVLIVKPTSYLRATVASAAVTVATNTTSPTARSGGAVRTKRRGTTKRGQTTTHGQAEVHHLSTKRSRLTTMARFANAAAYLRSSFITRMKTVTTQQSTTSNQCVSGATRCTMAASRTCRRITRRRHSQCPAKAGVYTLNYGMKEKKLARDLGISVEEATALTTAYMNTYPAVRGFFEEAVEETRECGYSWTILGRRRFLQNILSDNNMDRWADERKATNCLDYNTEALTKRGWVKGPDLLLTDEILTKNADSGLLEWQHPTNIKLFPNYEGPLVTFKSKTFDAVTTPEHRWLVYNKGANRNECQTSATLSRWGDHRIHRTGNYEQKESKFVDDYVELLGWILTDGFYKSNKTSKLTTIGICQSERANLANVLRIDALLRRLGQPTNRHVRPDSKCVYWDFAGPQAQRIRDLFPKRKLTHAFLSQISTGQAKLLLEIFLLADGHIEEVSGKRQIAAEDREEVDAIQTLCTLCGIATTSKWRDMSGYARVSSKMKNVPRASGCFYITLLTRDRIQVQHRHVKEVVVGKCPVWCPMVPNTYFVARRSGKVWITGNTPIQGSAADVVKMGMLRIFYEGDLERKYGCKMLLQIHDELMFECPKENVEIVKPIIREMMEHSLPTDLAVPLSISMGVGRNWSETH